MGNRMGVPATLTRRSLLGGICAVALAAGGGNLTGDAELKPVRRARNTSYHGRK